MLPIHIVTVIAVIACKDKFLLVRRNSNEPIYPGKWQNLGGKVEEEELIEEALTREIREEVGLVIIQKPIYLQSYSWRMIQDEPNRLGLIFLFLLKGNENDYHIILNEELSEFGWFHASDVMTLDAVGDHAARAGTFGQITEALGYLSSFSKK